MYAKVNRNLGSLPLAIGASSLILLFITLNKFYGVLLREVNNQYCKILFT